MLHLLGVEREQAGVLKCLAHGRDVVGGFLNAVLKIADRHFAKISLCRQVALATSSVGIRSGSASRGGSSPIAQEPAAAQQHRMLCCSGTDSPLAGLTAGGVHDVSETDEINLGGTPKVSGANLASGGCFSKGGSVNVHWLVWG